MYEKNDFLDKVIEDFFKDISNKKYKSAINRLNSVIKFDNPIHYQAKLLNLLGKAYFSINQDLEGKKFLEEALELYIKLDDQQEIAEIYFLIGSSSLSDTFTIEKKITYLIHSLNIFSILDDIKNTHFIESVFSFLVYLFSLKYSENKSQEYLDNIIFNASNLIDFYEKIRLLVIYNTNEFVNIVENIKNDKLIEFAISGAIKNIENKNNHLESILYHLKGLFHILRYTINFSNNEKLKHILNAEVSFEKAVNINSFENSSEITFIFKKNFYLHIYYLFQKKIMKKMYT